MQQVLEMLQRYQAAAKVAAVGPLAVPLEPERELKGLLDAVAHDGGGEAGGRPKAMDVDALWRRWQRAPGHPETFTRRELRALCWDERAVGDAAFLKALQDAGHLPQRLTFMRGMWHAYQAHWRLPNAATVERLLRGASVAPGHHPRWLRSLSQRPRLLGPDAHIDVAEGIASEGWKAKAQLEAVGITPSGQLGIEGLRHARKEWIDAVGRRRTAADVGIMVDAGREGLLSPDMCELSDFQHATERLLETVAGSGSPLRDALARMIVTDVRLGRPTQPKFAHHWATYSRDARNTAVRLFAARDLQAFFQLLIGGQDDYQQRRSFWERYVNSPQLTDFAIACDSEDRRLLMSRWGRERGEVAWLDGSPDNYSAFLMRFSGRYDIIIAEISRPNNAMYLFETSVFERVVGDLMRARFKFDRLKDRTLASDWWVHRGDWHANFEDKLRLYGVYPGGRW